MALYSISDLHLSLKGDKPMNVFGDNWFMHHEKIKENWLKKISNEDTVLICGDISWSIKMEEGLEDLNWLHELPGRKILCRGNHDYWWNSISKLNNLYEDIHFIQNNFFLYEDYALCGSRGWNLKTENYTEHDYKILNREIIRLKLSLDAAVTKGYSKIIVLMHYPPVTDTFESSPFTRIFSDYGVKTVLYGHLHGPSLQKVFNGEIDGVNYILTSSDYLNFDPILLKK